MRRTIAAVIADTRYVMTIGRRSSAASSVAVPLATSATSQAPMAVVRMPEQHGDGQFACLRRPDRLLEALARLAGDQGHDEARLRQPFENAAGRLDEQRRHHLDLGLPAPRQQRDDWRVQGQAQLVAKLVAVDRVGNHVGERDGPTYVTGMPARS